MKTISQFLDLYPKETSKRVYRAGIYTFFEFVYGVKRNGQRATKTEIGQFERYAEQYLMEKRDYTDDLMRFAASLNSKPPMTARSYMAGMKEFLAYNGVELTQRQLKTIRLKLPKGSTRTIEKDMDSTTIRKIVSHMDIKGKALVLTLASSGMRIGEALQIALDGLDLAATPATITIRGEYAKTGEQRFVFISREAREALEEWLKVRDRYLESAQNKNNGLVGAGIAKTKATDDNRVFPFSEGTVNQFWTNALTRAGLLSIDNGTNRKQLRIHQMRKFFRSQLALGCPVDIVEALMGHEGYLTGAYRRYTKAQMAEFYMKNEHLLYISMPKDIQKIESEFRGELDKNRKLVEDLILENRQLKKDIEEVAIVNRVDRERIAKLGEVVHKLAEMAGMDVRTTVRFKDEKDGLVSSDASFQIAEKGG